MNPAVTDYISSIKQAWQAEVCSRIRQIILDAVPGIEERIQYSKPHFLKNGKYAFVLSTAKGWVSFTLFNAQTLEAPEGFFEPSDTSDRKTVKIREGETVDYALLTTLVQQAAS
jgi:hypothetical protein